MSQNPNSTKNLVISVALLALIISSGAYTIYQFIQNQPTTQPITSKISSTTTKVSVSSVVDSNTPGSNDTDMKKNEINQVSDVKVIFDPYISGQSITGMVDKNNSVQSFVVKFTEINQPNNVLEFKPTIDEQKNFKIALDNNVKNADYRVEYILTNLNQNETKGEIMISVKTELKSQTIVNSQEISTKEIAAPQDTFAKAEIPAPTIDYSNNSKKEQLPMALGQAQPQSNQYSNQETVKINTEIETTQAINPDAIRTGGTNISVLLSAVILVFLGYASLVKNIYKKPDLESIFGKTK
jgi:hypothetical protein